MTGVSLSRISRNLVIPPGGFKTNSPNITEKGSVSLVDSGIASEPVIPHGEKTENFNDAISEYHLRKLSEANDRTEVRFSLSRIRESEAECQSARALDALDKVATYLATKDFFLFQAYYEAAPCLGRHLTQLQDSLKKVRRSFEDQSLFQSITENTSQANFSSWVNQLASVQTELAPLKQVQQEVHQVI